MKKGIVYSIICFLVIACSEEDLNQSPTPHGKSEYAAICPGSGCGGGGGEQGSGADVKPGQITAADWSDTLNFERFLTYLRELQQKIPMLQSLQPEAFEEQDPELVESLDIAFVVDTTGSMGDELNYLKAEMKDLIERVHKLFPNKSKRYALVFYRDTFDEYVVRTFDFIKDSQTVLNHLKNQHSAGGADYEEAVQEAFHSATQLSWSDLSSTRKIMFHLADAPPHDVHLTDFLKQVEQLKQRQVKIYSIAASGTDDRTEALMRYGSQETGGRYIFVTNDSGIGNNHKEPTQLPCYNVQLLNDLLLRMIQGEIHNEYLPPESSDILKQYGSVQQGKCLKDQQVVGRIW